MRYRYLFTLKVIKHGTKVSQSWFFVSIMFASLRFTMCFKPRCLKGPGMVRCKRTKLYASPAYSRVFPSIYAAHSIEVKASKTRRRGLSFVFSSCKWKVAFPKDERGCNRESTSFSLGGLQWRIERGTLESLGLPFERTVNLRMLYWNILRIYSKEYEDRLIQKERMHHREIALIRAKLILLTISHILSCLTFFYSYRVLSKPRYKLSY